MTSAKEMFSVCATTSVLIWMYVWAISDPLQYFKVGLVAFLCSFHMQSPFITYKWHSLSKGIVGSFVLFLVIYW